MNLCLFCGIDTKNPKYCSLSCSVKNQHVTGKAFKRPSKPPIECFACGILTTNLKYCSRNCAAHINNKIYTKRLKEFKDIKIRYCSVCKKVFQKKHYPNQCSQLCNRISRVLNGTAAAPLIKKVRLEIDGVICSICKRTEWEGRPIPLVLDHINGHSEENTWANTRLVCGNCDMQLPTYKAKNKGNGRHSRQQRYVDGKSY